MSASDPDSGSDESDGGAATAMAAAMGFSSFGQQSRPSKKRRLYNPQTDDATSESASGANTTPLPPPPIHARGSALGEGNPGEVSLDLDLSMGQNVDGGAPVSGIHAGVGGESLSPLTAGPGLPARPAFTNLTTASTAASSSINGLPLSHPPSHNGSPSFVGGRGGGRGGSGDGGRTRGEGGGGRDRNPNWYIGYYDRSSNLNPWAKLEVRTGLDPRGDWTLDQ